MSTIPAEVRDRVIAAAVELYEQADRQRFPTVDAVRRLSRADMNTVSNVMRDWRQSQTRQVETVTVAVPEAIQQANAAAVAALWLTATDLANQSLRSAQAGWEKERAELDDMRTELAETFEVQAAELDKATQQLAESATVAEAQAQELATVRQTATDALARAERAEARATDLRDELDRSIQEIERQRAELADVRAKAEASNAAMEATKAELATVQAQAADHAKQAAADALRASQQLVELQADRDQVRAALATANAKVEAAAAEALRATERSTKAEADRDTARQQAAQAREDAAKLAGQLEATQTQAASLMQTLAANGQPQAAVKAPAKTTKAVNNQSSLRKISS